MSEFRIIGDPTPVVGKEEWYSVSQLLPSLFPFQNLSNAATNPFEQHVEWSVYVLENGRWIQKEENNKTGNKVPYKFTQKSLERKGIRILAKRGDQVARLDIKPHKAESPKIDSIEFLDKLGNKPTKPFAYGQTLKARVHCLHMERRTVYATLWEDDVAGVGHDKANEKNKMKTLPGTVKGGIADIDFVLDPDFAKIADAVKAKGDADEGKTHEYYVTAEILNKKTASKNTNVANPNYKNATVKPAVPKKQTPAQKKGLSKKQEKEKTILDDVIDWWEGIFNVKPIIVPNPIDIINGIVKIFTPENKTENGVCVCKDYDLVWGDKLSCDERKKVVEVSKKLGVDPNWLMSVIALETSRTFNPSIDNGIGYVGLVQFGSATAETVGTTQAKLIKMTFIEQMNYVEQFLIGKKAKYKTLTDLYLAVLYPKACGHGSERDYVVLKGAAYRNNPSFFKEDDEYVEKVNKRGKKEKVRGPKEGGETYVWEVEIAIQSFYTEGLALKEKNFTCEASQDKDANDKDGVLEEMKILVDKHIPYSQLGVRNSLSDKGLEGLDCSETVGIYLHKLGVMPTLKSIDTSLMTSQSKFRNAIGSSNIDFITDSDKKDFKPQRGDIFVWRDGDGHTGIVYEYDESKDVVTILEAIGASGAVSESDQVKNGGYSKKDCSRTAKYHRLKGALYGHRGWVGFYRPKNYTKKL